MQEFRKKILGFKILKFFDANPDPGSGIFLTRDPGWKKTVPGSERNIPDPQKSTVKSTQGLSRLLNDGRHLGFLFLNRYCPL
jgi:hypothetical protein